MPAIIPPAPLTGITKYQWITPNNLVKELSRDYSNDIFIETGSTGLGLPEFNIENDKLPFSPLSFITQINTEPRIITLPLFVKALTFESLLLTCEEIHDWFATGDEESKTPGYLRVTRADDTVRQIACYFQRGLLGNTNEGSPTFGKYNIELFCPDPYPTDIANTVITKQAELANLNYTFGVLNSGKLQAYPIWKLQGPYTNITITNTTTGKHFDVVYSSPGNEYMIIDTRPSELRTGPSVYDQAGVNRISRISSTSDFFALEPGLNNINILNEFVNTDITYIELTYLTRYRSLLR